MLTVCRCIPFCGVADLKSWELKRLFLRSHPHTPGKFSTGPFTNSSEEICFLVRGWGSLGYLPRGPVGKIIDCWTCKSMMHNLARMVLSWCHDAMWYSKSKTKGPSFCIHLVAVCCSCIWMHSECLPCAWLQTFKTAQSQVVGRFHLQCGLFGHHGLFARLGGWMWVWAFGTTSSRPQITFCGQSGLLVQSLCFLPLLCVHAFDGACL